MWARISPARQKFGIAKPLLAEGLRLRRAGDADAQAAKALTDAAYTPWIALIGREPGPMLTDFSRAVRAHVIDLLYRDDKLVGMIETIPSDGFLYIENVAILPEQHGQGLGRFLMAHAQAFALSLGLPELRLHTNARFARNLKLYAALGFVETERVQAMRVGTIVRMAKQLA